MRSINQLPVLPETFLDSLKGAPGFAREGFVRVHEAGDSLTSVRFNPQKTDPKELTENQPWPIASDPSFSLAERVPWSSHGFYLQDRPSFIMDPLWHAGLYYVQEASSMFLEQALTQCLDLSDPRIVLDLCAAPGGKSTHIQSLLSAGSLLVSNETIRTRVGILAENSTRWGALNTVVSSADPSLIGKLENLFDVMVVDAPCSGSGLFRREPEAIGEWNLRLVETCSARQQRILADAWPALKPGGLLVYSTCSYSIAEDEMILDWLIGQFDAEPVSLHLDKNWHIVESVSAKHGATGYRFYPDQLKGEGLFLCCLRKKERSHLPFKLTGKNNRNTWTRAQQTLVGPWLKPDLPLAFREHDGTGYALPAAQAGLIEGLRQEIPIRKAGVCLGKITARELIPDHELALSGLLSPTVPSIVLSREEAIRYLQKEPLDLEQGTTGWALATYAGESLGWMKLLGNRINNYYPSDWRILKRN